jgi:hypothetical protein
MEVPDHIHEKITSTFSLLSKDKEILLWLNQCVDFSTFKSASITGQQPASNTFLLQQISNSYKDF